MLSATNKIMYADFISEHLFCWNCGVWSGDWYGQPMDGIDYCRKLETHHIRRGISRVDDRRNLSRLCKLCHDLAGNASIRVNGKLLPRLDLHHVLWLKNSHDGPVDRKFLMSISSPPWLPWSRKPLRFWQRIYLSRHTHYPHVVS